MSQMKLEQKEQLKQALSMARLTQSEIAGILGVRQSVISKVINNGFGYKLAQKWEKIFGFSRDWLLTGEGEMFTSENPKLFEYKGQQNARIVFQNEGSAANVVQGNADMRTYRAEKIIKENGDVELYSSAQDSISYPEVQIASLNQRIADLEKVIAVKDELISSLKETINLLKNDRNM